MAPETQEQEGGNKRNISLALWSGLTLVLYVATFGFMGAMSFIFYVIMFLAGFLSMITNWSVRTSNEILSSDDVNLLAYEEPYCGIPTVFKHIENAPQRYKYDKRLTGSSCIDEVMQEVIQFFFRDYIHFWYFTISDDERFLYELRLIIQKCIISLATRSKEVEWVPFLTTRIVDDFATHLRIFRITQERLQREKENSAMTPNNLTTEEATVQEEIDLETMFFTVESEVEKGLCRGPICLDDEAEKQYLQDITEVLLYLLLTPEDFHNKTIRLFLREIIATSVLLPTVNMICDPDYVNQIVSWLCARETTFTADSFLTTIRLSDSIEDVKETKRKVDLEIAKLRSQDSNVFEESELTVKKQLNSLMYVRKLCITTIRRLKNGMTNDSIAPMEGDPEPDLMELLSPNQNIPKLSLRKILEENTALSYFIEFMGTYNAEHYVFFHLTIEGFRATAIQQLSILAEETSKAVNEHKTVPTQENFEQLKQAAANIYEEYLSPKASPRIALDDQMVRKIVKDIKSSEPSGAYFDSAHMAVYKILESPKYYGSFVQSTSYIKCLMELDLLTKSDDGHSDDESASLSNFSVRNTSRTSTLEDVHCTNEPWTPDVDLRYSALIGQAGVFKEDGDTYVNYTLHVCRTTSSGSRNWVVMRRYSDFHDLHMQLREKFPLLTWLNLPAKKTFGNKDQEFIEKRRNQLEDYIQPLLDTTLLAENPGLFELVAGFLEQGDYYKGKSFMSRKMDHIVQPMQRSFTNMKSAVKNKAQDVSKWSGDIGEMFSSHKNSEKVLIMNSNVNLGKLSDAFDAEVDENIPLRILLLLMDEVFDLQHRNQWLRRRIVVLLRKIIKTVFGDGINRKIVDYVDFATNSQQIAEYVKQFRDSYWPGGVLADPVPERPPDVRRRMRMVTKAKMIGSIPDELKRFLGTAVVREGASRVFDVFQHVNLNKRLFYVMFEAFLETTFPDNKFSDIFTKIHTKKRT